MIGYSIAGTGNNLLTMIVSSFLLVYCTNVIGVSALTVGTVMGVSKMFGGLSDLVAGYIIDRTHTKWGKCRPWLIRMIIPMIVCMLLLFWVPSSLTGIP